MDSMNSFHNISRVLAKIPLDRSETILQERVKTNTLAIQSVNKSLRRGGDAAWQDALKGALDVLYNEREFIKSRLGPNTSLPNIEEDGTFESPEEDIRKRVLKACKNPGVPEYLIDRFISQFSGFLTVNKQGWSDVSEAELTHYINQFVGAGRL
jgi:hypothetical protein